MTIQIEIDTVEPELLYRHFDNTVPVVEAYVRIRVFGGWMVTHAITNAVGNAQSSVFIPDSCHDWKI